MFLLNILETEICNCLTDIFIIVCRGLYQWVVKLALRNEMSIRVKLLKKFHLHCAVCKVQRIAKFF